MEASEKDKLEALERALQEIDALEAIYGDDFSVLCADLDQARRCLAAAGEGIDQIPRITVELTIQVGNDAGAITCRLQCGMPPGYPSLKPAVATVVSADGSSRKDRDEWSALLSSRAQELVGTEAIMELAQELVEIIIASKSQGLDEEDLADDQEAEDEEAAAAADSEPRTSVARRWIWVHHITNTDRKKAIVQEAKDLKLGGWLKPGYPGVVVVEGEACDEFVVWIKGNKSRPGGFGRNWGHHVRGEAYSDSRLLPTEFEQLEEDMSVFASLCKTHGVEDEFLEYVMQHNRS